MSDNETKPMIRLRGLGKTFSGQERPAVADLDLDVPEGEIVVLVGPSGCGKTTTLRLINRLIEPSTGTIELDGEDVTDVKADPLRRRIGYVIQQVGLFPHQTIAQNIATVPQMIGWDSARIESRVDELLELVGMEPADYRGRYPRELSGGQSQRVGVARAMAADPPVLLMDEPFGAIDPITRERLQDEFLKVQGTIRKTIVFVTHDIDEATKMGDRICLLRVGGQIAQYDTPERILTAPADDFVADFIGAGPLVRGLRLARISDIDLGDPVAVANGAPVVDVRASLHEALNQMLASDEGHATVVDEHGERKGTIDLATLSKALMAMREGSESAPPAAERPVDGPEGQ